MKEKNIRVFDSEDYEFIKCLRNIGIERKQAMVLAFSVLKRLELRAA